MWLKFFDSMIQKYLISLLLNFMWHHDSLCLTALVFFSNFVVNQTLGLTLTFRGKFILQETSEKDSKDGGEKKVIFFFFFSNQKTVFKTASFSTPTISFNIILCWEANTLPLKLCWLIYFYVRIFSNLNWKLKFREELNSVEKWGKKWIQWAVIETQQPQLKMQANAQKGTLKSVLHANGPDVDMESSNNKMHLMHSQSKRFDTLPNRRHPSVQKCPWSRHRCVLVFVYCSV